MSVKKWHRMPRGEHQCPGEGTRREGQRSRKKKFLLWGILIAGILSQQIRIEAAASDLIPQDEVEIPKEIIEYCETVGKEYDLCPELLEAMAYNESRFKPTVKNGNCWGLLQVNIKVHKDRIEKCGYSQEDMLESYPNIVVAADLLAELFDTYGDDAPIVLSYYSGDPKAVAKYKEYGFITEYVETILTRSEKYERIHGK